MSTSWYLKKTDGSIYGPVRMVDLKQWAKDSRIAPEDMLSHDQTDWMPAPELAALEMIYLVRYRHGVEYGPVHLRALCELLIDGDVPLDESVLDKTTNKTLPACVAALRGLMAEEPSEASVAPRPVGEEADRLRAEHQTAMDEVNEKLLSVLEEKKGLEAEVGRLDEQRQALEEQVRALTEEIERVKKESDARQEEMAAERDRLQGELDEVKTRREAEQAALEEKKRDLSTDRTALVEAKNKAERRVAELEEQQQEAQQQAGRARAEVKSLREKLTGAEDQPGGEDDSRVAKLQKKLDEETARREKAEQEAATRVQEASASNVTELKEQLENERERHRKREASLQQRMAQFEGDLKNKLEELVRAKEATESTRQAALTDSSGQGTHPVVRAALSRAKSQSLRRGSDIHSPQSPAQKASLLGRTREKPPARPKRWRKAGGRSA